MRGVRDISPVQLRPVPPTTQGGRPWVLPVPQDAATVRDYLITRKDYLIWTVIRNNFPAVRDKLRTVVKEPEQLTSAAALYNVLLSTPDEELRDIIADIPWIGGEDKVQDEAFHLMWEEVRGMGSVQEKFIPLVLAGIGGLAMAISQGGQSAEAAEAAQAVAQQQAAADYEEQQERAAAWEKTKRWLIPAALAVVGITLLIIIKTMRR